MLVPTIVLVSDSVAAYLLGTQFVVSLLCFLFVIVIILKTLNQTWDRSSVPKRKKQNVYLCGSSQEHSRIGPDLHLCALDGCPVCVVTRVRHTYSTRAITLELTQYLLLNNIFTVICDYFPLWFFSRLLRKTPKLYLSCSQGHIMVIRIMQTAEK